VDNRFVFLVEPLLVLWVLLLKLRGNPLQQVDLSFCKLVEYWKRVFKVFVHFCHHLRLQRQWKALQKLIKVFILLWPLVVIDRILYIFEQSLRKVVVVSNTVKQQESLIDHGLLWVVVLHDWGQWAWGKRECEHTNQHQNHHKEALGGVTGVDIAVTDSRKRLSDEVQRYEVDLDVAFDFLALVNDWIILESEPAAFLVKVGHEDPHAGEDVDRHEDEKPEEHKALQTLAELQFAFHVSSTSFLLHQSGQLGQPNEFHQTVEARNPWEFGEHVEFARTVVVITAT
jgi:hypothetical protein